MLGQSEVSTVFDVLFPEGNPICEVTAEGLVARAQATGKLTGADAALEKGDTYQATSGSCFAGDRMIGVDNGGRDVAVGGTGFLLGVVFATAVVLARRRRTTAVRSTGDDTP